MRNWFLSSLFLVLALSVEAQTDCHKALSGLGTNWYWDKVTVPFDWENPSNSEKIDVYYYFKDQKRFETKKPIVFFNGGPTMAGYSAIYLFNKIKQLENENIIFIDQRGAGCSTGFKNYAPNSNIETFKKYSSDSIVKDAEVIRKKLFGPGKWKVFGQSYGGLISFRYLELFPGSIESAHIHGFGLSLESRFLETREKRIGEITPEFLEYKNPKITKLSVGQIIEQIKNGDNKKLFSSICVDTPRALMNKLCGEDLFQGLYMIMGFKSLWATAHNYLYNLSRFIEEGNHSELSAYFEKFTSNYLLRFNDINQAAALHAITFNELVPGKLFYEGCQDEIENQLISECRFKRNFLPRIEERPSFKSNPLDLDIIKTNLKHFNVPIFYYAGMYDTFIPVDLVSQTADYLDISSSLHIFKKSGHEGYSTEKLVIGNLVGM